MQKTRSAVMGLLLVSALMLGACASQPPATETVPEQPAGSEEMTEEQGEMMAEEEGEMMSEEEAMADSETMDDQQEMAGSEMMGAAVTFLIRIENTAPAGGLTVLAPGAYELNDHPVAFFTPGEPDRGLGLEALAEDGTPGQLVAEINAMMDEMSGEGMMGFVADVFNTPQGADAPGPAGPGQAYEFTVEAYPGQYLTFASMFVHSNDWFFAPGAEGIALFDMEGNPIQGDVSDQVFLWNAGTEVDQIPGQGADQAPRQSAPNTGEAEGGVVSQVEGFDDYQIRVTISPQA